MTKEELKPIDVSKYTVTENGNVIKDKLKQEAEEWINKWELCNKCDHKAECIEDNAMCPQVVDRAYLASAEPREKRIEELEAQIEKMKCCGNCAKNGHICVAEEMQGKLCGKNKDKWELRR